jgi:hypothetical protein
MVAWAGSTDLGGVLILGVGEVAIGDGTAEVAAGLEVGKAEPGGGVALGFG